MLQLHHLWLRIKDCWLNFEQRLIDGLISTENKRMMMAAELLDVSEAQLFERAWASYGHRGAVAVDAQQAYREYLRTDHCPPWMDAYLDRVLDEFERHHLLA